ARRRALSAGRAVRGACRSDEHAARYRQDAVASREEAAADPARNGFEMTCEDVLNAVDLIAAGELAEDARISSHLATCPSCSSALESARRLDALLRQRPVPMPSAQFTARTMARIRRARWRNEQTIDWIFNAALVLVALGITAGLWIIARRTGITFVGNDALQLFGAGMH